MRTSPPPPKHLLFTLGSGFCPVPFFSSEIEEPGKVMALKDYVLTWQGHLTLTSDAKNFYYKYTRVLLKDGKPLKQKAWEETIPRDHQ